MMIRFRTWYGQLIDTGHRIAYRLAYPIARYWFDRCDSVGIAVWVQDTVLVVRHSYRDGLDMPGGHVRAREDIKTAARRELLEEVGLDLNPSDLVWKLNGNKSDHSQFHLFETHLDTMPVLGIDRREIIFAAFLPAEVLINDATHPLIVGYLNAHTLVAA